MLEKTVEEILKRHVDRIWPDRDFRFVGSQRRLDGGNIIDLCFLDTAKIHWIVELKRNRINGSTVRQLVRYLNALKVAEPTKTYKGIVAGFTVSASAMAEAAGHDVCCQKLDEEMFRLIAQENGLKLDHASRARPKRSGSNLARSRPVSSKSRPPFSSATLELLQKLDEEFPPGSLTHKTSIDRLKQYWATACPHAPIANQEIAATLSDEVLRLVPTAAIAKRSQSKSDPYTTICALDGRVAAAIDARHSYVKLDFPLSYERAKVYTEQNLIRIWNARGYSYWVQSRVRATNGLGVSQAKQMLQEGLRFEFEGTSPN